MAVAMINNIDVNVLRREFQNTLSTLLLNNNTFILGMIIKAARVIASPDEPTLSTDGKTLRINPDFFLKATPQERIFLLAHEALHVARMDPVRFANYAKVKGYSPELQVIYNLVADAKINSELQNEIKVNVPKGGVTCDELAQFGISVDECVEKSTEELVDKILQNAQAIKVSLPIKDISIPQQQEQQSSEQQASGSQGQQQQQEQGEGQEQQKQGQGEQGQQNQQQNQRQGQQQNQGQTQTTGHQSAGQCIMGKQPGQGQGHGQKKQAAKGNSSQGQQGRGYKESPSGSGQQKGGETGETQQSQSGNTPNGNEIVLNEGDKDLQKANEKELRNKIVQIIYTASIVKNIGSLPGWAKRLVDELTREKIDWRRILAKYLHGAINVRRKLTRENRKNPDLIGKEILGKARIVVIVDTSGSIGEKELRQFISEVRAMTPYSEKIVVIPFDTQPYGEYVVRTREDVKHIQLTGGGGTMIGSTLELVDKKYDNKVDAIVILSDWLIGDLTDQKVTALLRKYARKIIAVTTSAEPPKYLPNRLKIEELAKR